MRWPRHHDTNTPLDELMDDQPTPDAASHAGPAADDDTAARIWPSDYTNDAVGSEQRPRRESTTLSTGTVTDAGGPVETGTATEGDSSAEGDSSTEGDSLDDNFLDDEDYLPQQRHGPARLTVALLATLVLAVGVLGGIWVDKQFGTTSSASGFPSGAALPGGMPGSGGGMAGGARSGGASTGASGTSSDAGEPGAGNGSATPAVVGTVSSVSAKTLVVTDLGGTKHTVTLTSTTTLTTPYHHGTLKAGDTVAVSGSTDSDGTVTATGLTVT